MDPIPDEFQDHYSKFYHDLPIIGRVFEGNNSLLGVEDAIVYSLRLLCANKIDMITSHLKSENFIILLTDIKYPSPPLESEAWGTRGILVRSPEVFRRELERLSTLPPIIT